MPRTHSWNHGNLAVENCEHRRVWILLWMSVAGRCIESSFFHALSTHSTAQRNE
jgi:hypothetical protein